MNDYEMMNQRVDQLRHELAWLNKSEAHILEQKKAVMDELLDTRRQITRADKAAKAVLRPQPKVLADYFPHL